MRVGFFCGALPAEHGGGHTFQAEMLAAVLQHAADSRHEFVVFSPDLGQWSAQAVQFVHLPPTPLERLKSRLPSRLVHDLHRRLQQFGVLGMQKSWMRTVIPPAVRASGVDMFWYPAQHLFLTLEIPYIATVWDLQHRTQPYFPEVSCNSQWERRERLFATVLRRSAFVLAGTAVGKAQIEHFYQLPAEQIRVLPLPTPAFALGASPPDETLSRYGLPEGYLFYPAQFWPHKNHAGLLKALRLLRDDGLKLPLVFAGADQGNEAHIKRLCTELELSNQVHFLGFVPQVDLVALYRHALALVFVSLAGPDNLPPLEAFALGCPVIAADVPGAREQLEDAALFVNPKDEAAIARAVRTLHQDPTLRQALTRRGELRARRWTGQDYVKSVFAILDEFEPIRRCWEH